MPSLRIANIMYAGTPVLALEHRDQLLSVPMLEHRMGIESSPARFTDRAHDFKQRVFSLGMAGLDELIDCLGDAPGPREALLDRDLCMMLPPTIATPGMLEFSVRADDEVPRFRWANGRCLRGHEAPLPIPPDEPCPQVDAQVAAVLGDDLRHATVQEAERAIAGYAVLCTWSLPSRDRLSPGWGSHRIGQLGPCLFVPGGPFDPARSDVSIAVNDTQVVFAAGRPWKASLAQMIAFASEAADLLAGDVIASGPLARTSSDGRRSLHDGDKVTAEIAGIGRLTGVIVTSKRKSKYL